MEKKVFRVSDEDVKLMRAAGIPVPESIEEVKKLLEEAEADKEEIDLDEAFRQLRAHLRRRLGSTQNA